MEVKIDKAEFIKSLDRVSPALGTNVLVPAFQCLQFHDGFVTATDGVMVIKSKCMDNIEIESAIPGPQFLSLLKGLGGKTIGIKKVEENVCITSARGKIKGKFTTVTPTDPPPTPECEMLKSDDNFAKLFDGLNFCRYSVSRDETTGPRCGVRVDGNKVYSTDKFRIARYNIHDYNFSAPFTVPLKFVNILLKFRKDVREIGICKDTHIVVRLNDGTLLYSGLLEGEYRSLEGFFPSEDVKFTKIGFPEALTPVLDRHIAFLKDVDSVFKKMNVTIKGKSCTFVSVDTDLGILEEELDLSSEVDIDVVFPINPLFWTDVSLRCSEFHYIGTEEEDNELILFRTDDLAYLCRPDRRPGEKK